MANEMLPGIHLLSNIDAKRIEWRKKIEEFPKAIDAALGANAVLALRESIVQIDALIYSTPESESYHRTKNLRRSNKVEKLGEMTWLVFNDAEYAEPVHDGTSQMQPRPWMKNAIDTVQEKMDENLLEAGTRALAGGDQPAAEEADEQLAETEPSASEVVSSASGDGE